MRWTKNIFLFFSILFFYGFSEASSFFNPRNLASRRDAEKIFNVWEKNPDGSWGTKVIDEKNYDPKKYPFYSHTYEEKREIKADPAPSEKKAPESIKKEEGRPNFSYESPQIGSYYFEFLENRSEYEKRPELYLLYNYLPEGSKKKEDSVSIPDSENSEALIKKLEFVEGEEEPEETEKTEESGSEGFQTEGEQSLKKNTHPALGDFRKYEIAGEKFYGKGHEGYSEIKIPEPEKPKEITDEPTPQKTGPGEAGGTGESLYLPGSELYKVTEKSLEYRIGEPNYSPNPAAGGEKIPWALWTDFRFGKISKKSPDVYLSNFNGLFVGFDLEPSENSAAGLSCGILRIFTKYRGGKGRAGAWIISGRGLRFLSENLYWDGLLSLSGGNIKNFNLYGGEGTEGFLGTKAGFRYRSISSGLNYPLSSGIALRLTPFVKFRYSKYERKAFNAASRSINAVPGSIEESVEGSFGSALSAGEFFLGGLVFRPFADFSYSKNLRYSGKNPIKYSYEAGLGASVLKESFEVFFKFDSSFGKRYESYQGSVRISFNF